MSPRQVRGYTPRHARPQRRPRWWEGPGVTLFAAVLTVVAVFVLAAALVV